MPIARSDQILDAAMECFGSKGYRATTMPDIEAAAGLAPGTGGTYRHFASKQAILEAAVDRELQQNDDVLAPPPSSLADAARDGLAQLDRQRNLTRVLFRDLDQFPELMTSVVERLIRGPYRLVAERTAAVAPGVDAEAMAAIMVGSLVNYKVIETMVGERAGGVDEERLIAAWAHLYGLLIKSGSSIGGTAEGTHINPNSDKDG